MSATAHRVRERLAAAAVALVIAPMGCARAAQPAPVTPQAAPHASTAATPPTSRTISAEPSARTSSARPSARSPSRPTSAAPTATRAISTRHTSAATRSTTATSSAAACVLPAGLRGRDLETVSDRKVIALTFDAGASADGVSSILATLRSTDIEATFFLTGTWTKANPSAARTIASTYPVGNHSLNHPHFTQLSDAEIRQQLDSARQIIRDTTGQDPRPYFRFPFGDVSAHAISVVNGRCYVPFRWSVDTLGWKGTSGGMSAAKVTQRVLDGARPGAIILLHVGANPDDGTTLDADALPGIIASLRKAGYSFVTLEETLPSAP